MDKKNDDHNEEVRTSSPALMSSENKGPVHASRDKAAKIKAKVKSPKGQLSPDPSGEIPPLGRSMGSSNQLLSSTEDTAAARKPSSMREGIVVKSQHSYLPREKHQLPLQTGERLLILDKDASGWWIGRDQTGSVGLVPRTFVEADRVPYPAQELLWKLLATKEAIRLELDCGKALVPTLGRCMGHPVLTTDNLIPVVSQFRQFQFSRMTTPVKSSRGGGGRVSSSLSAELGSAEAEQEDEIELRPALTPQEAHLSSPAATQLAAAADEIVQTVPRSIALDVRRPRSSKRTSLAEMSRHNPSETDARAQVDDLYEMTPLALFDEYEKLGKRQAELTQGITQSLDRVAYYRLKLRDSEQVDSVMETLESAKGEGGGNGLTSTYARSRDRQSLLQSQSQHRGIMRMSMADKAMSMASSILAEDSSPSGKITAELQRKQILVDKLATLEKNLAEAEKREGMLLDRLCRRKVEIPQCIVEYQQELARRNTISITSPRDSESDETASNKQKEAEEDHGWLKGVEIPQCREYLSHLQRKFLALNDEIDDLELELEASVSQYRQMQKQIKGSEAEMEEQDRNDEEELEAYLSSLQAKAEAAKEEYKKLKADASGDGGVGRVRAEVEDLQQRALSETTHQKTLKEQLETFNAKLAEMRELAASSAKVDALRAEIVDLRKEEEEAEKEYKAFADSLGERLAAKKAAYRTLERKRRETYNAIQDLKGNLRVYCRIKPPSAHEKDECLEIIDDMTIQVKDIDTGRISKHEFDLVIGKDATQLEIFEEARPLATSVLDGYNVCIFAYGQTGSGKTYTMEGPPDNRGINYRTVQEIFSLAHGERKDDYNYTIAVSILEVYNDKAYDLMTSSRTQSKVRWMGGSGAQQHVGEVVVEPLTKKIVHSADEVQSVLDSAYKNRSVAGTDSNAHSSRSHSVLTVYVTAVNSATNTSLKAKLHLIDLAGSERVKASGVEGDRLKEATHINSSLSHLKTVIQALANKKGFVSYRNSTLTSLLQDSLGGNCKTLMFANISAHTGNIPESLCTIKYAAEARKVEVGKVSANTASSSTGTTAPK